MLYPDNVEIKLYLLSVLVQVDSPEKANTIIEDMKLIWSPNRIWNSFLNKN